MVNSTAKDTSMLNRIRDKLKTFIKAILTVTGRFVHRWWLLIFLLSGYLIFWHFEFGFVPDLLKVSTVNPSEYFNIIIGATASIFGILVTVILLTFELVRQTLFKRPGANILNNPIVTNFLSLGVMSIVLSFASYVTIQNLNSDSSITVAYFVGYVFVTFILSIYPFMKRILYSTSGLLNAAKLIRGLSIDDFDIIDFGTNSVSLLEDNSAKLYQIRSELIRMVRENDFEGYNLILQNLNLKVIELQVDGKNRDLMRRIQRGLILIWKGSNLEGIRANTYQYYDSVWESILTLYVNAIKKKHPFLHYQEIAFYQRGFINLLSRNRLHDNLIKGAKVMSNVFTFSLAGNLPRQTLLYDLYYYFDREGMSRDNSGASLQWGDIIEFLDSVFKIQRISITNGDRDLYESCSQEISVITSKIQMGEFELEDMQEAYIIINIIINGIWNAETALETNLFKKVHEAFKVEKYLLESAIEVNKLYVAHVMPLIGKFIISMHQSSKLEFSTTLTDWRSIGLFTSQYYDRNETAKKAINYIVATLNIIKIEIEESQLPKELEKYKELENSLIYFKQKLVKEHGEKAKELTNRIQEIIASFKTVENLGNKENIKWGD